METFSALLALYVENSPVTGEFPSQRPVTRSFDVVFDLRLNKRLSKQSWDWWFETPSRPLWLHCTVIGYMYLLTCYDSEKILVCMQKHKTNLLKNIIITYHPDQPICIDLPPWWADHRSLVAGGGKLFIDQRVRSGFQLMPDEEWMCIILKLRIIALDDVLIIAI